MRAALKRLRNFVNENQGYILLVSVGALITGMAYVIFTLITK